MKRLVAALAFLVLTLPILAGQTSNASLAAAIDARVKAIESKLVTWRRDFHQNPELSNRETRTAGIVAAHLRQLGLEVKTNVAHTGVVGVLRGGRPGPVVALRADMDGLPLTEQADLPFASKAKSTYNGQEVGVMHACGHDAHIAMLMATAEVLAGLKDQIPGTIKFIFQPAEEGAPVGEEGGASLMIKEGVLDNPKPAAIFGLHVMASIHSGEIAYRPGGVMAGADMLCIVVKGKGTHGALPWGGVDPIVTASQIVTGLQTIVSRQIDVTKSPAIVTIGTIHGGVRFNMIPDEVELLGTVRSFDPDSQEDLRKRIARTVQLIAESAGATANTTLTMSAPVTYNTPALTEKMLPTLRRVAGDSHVILTPPSSVAEDFAFYQQQVPGLFVFVGITPRDKDLTSVPLNHSPLFSIDESGLPLGVRTLANLAIDFLSSPR